MMKGPFIIKDSIIALVLKGYFQKRIPDYIPQADNIQPQSKPPAKPEVLTSRFVSSLADGQWPSVLLSFSQKYHQSGDVGGGDAGDARRLPEAPRADALQLLARLQPQAVEA